MRIAFRLFRSASYMTLDNSVRNRFAFLLPVLEDIRIIFDEIYFIWWNQLV